MNISTSPKGSKSHFGMGLNADTDNREMALTSKLYRRSWLLMDCVMGLPGGWKRKFRRGSKEENRQKRCRVKNEDVFLHLKIVGKTVNSSNCKEGYRKIIHRS